MIEKNGFFGNSGHGCGRTNGMTSNDSFFYAATYRSAYMPNIALHISHTFDENTYVVSVIDDNERILFYRPCQKIYLITVFDVFNLSRNLDFLLSGLEIVTHHDEHKECNP